MPTTPGDMALEASISLRLRSMNPQIDPNVSSLGGHAGILHVVYHVPHAGATMLDGWLHESGTIARIVSSLNMPRQGRSDAVVGASTKLDKKNTKSHGDSSPITVIALRDIIVLDIETLGLRDAAAITIGFASFQSGDIVIDQFILTDPCSEHTFFTRCIDFIRFQDPKMLVTFYGSKFDVPFLMDRARFLDTRVETEPSQARPVEKSEDVEKVEKAEKAEKVEKTTKSTTLQEDTASVFGRIRHVDLHALFKSLIPGLPKYNFQALERHILDVSERNDDIPGAEILPNYQAFLDATAITTKAHALARIIKHNFTDLVHSAFAFHAIIGKIANSIHNGSMPSRVLTPGENDARRVDPVRVQIEEAGVTADKPAPRDCSNGHDKPGMTQDPGLTADAIEIPRAKPIVMLQGDKINVVQTNLFNERVMHDITCMFRDGLDIPTAQAVLEKNNPGLHAMFERGGWFITLERLCREGVLERREVGDKITYKSTRTAPDLDHPADCDLSREMVVSSPPPITQIKNDPRIDKIQPTLTGQSTIGPDDNTFEMYGHAPVNSQVKSYLASNHDPVDVSSPVSSPVASPSEIGFSNPKSIASDPEIVSFKSIVFYNHRLQDIIRGWLATSGQLNINDAATALNVPRQDIMLYVFDQAGKGLINVRFKDDLFWVPHPAQTMPSESKAKRKTK